MPGDDLEEQISARGMRLWQQMHETVPGLFN